jgi:16S rRNA (adenine1518-N6/adenine1519-N6)-dimethyltransferase
MSRLAQNQDEIFDVVDAQNCVIGQARRKEIHAKGLLHRAIHIFWLKSDGQLCLQRRSYGKDSCPGLLSSSCAGHLDAGESYDTAAYRELGEELGFEPPHGSLVKLECFSAHPDLGNEFVSVYRLTSDYTAKIAEAEVDALLWRTPSEVDQWIVSDPGLFSTSLVHLFQQPTVRRALGLVDKVKG